MIEGKRRVPDSEIEEVIFGEGIQEGVGYVLAVCPSLRSGSDAEEGRGEGVEDLGL